jgi:hypothetical protein
MYKVFIFLSSCEKQAKKEGEDRKVTVQGALPKYAS